jgi:hypothetical protein
MKVATIAFSVVPFCWLWPRIDRCVIDTTILCGPFRAYWINK